MEPSISVEDLVRAKQDTLCLEHLNPDTGLDGQVSDPDVSGPGLALAGYLDRFSGGRIQVFGETEVNYLKQLGEKVRRERLAALFTRDIPVIFVSKGLPVPDELVSIATRAGIPVFRSTRATRDVFRKLKPFLERALAPTTTIHGSLADVFGVGLLFTGQSGIGKSECVLDLVERGHRLVADDLVIVTRRGNDILIGRGHELQQHHMEIRGVGIVDVRALFGVRATRQQKRVEVVVALESWDAERHYDRTGLDQDVQDILGVEVPRVTIPLNPGKNITVISEVVAMNHLVRCAGVDSAAEFDRRLRDAMGFVREYLEEDYE